MILEGLLDIGFNISKVNGYCSHIGNEFFAYFHSTHSKSKINFLPILRDKHTDYLLDIDAYNYMALNGLAESKLNRLERVSQSNGKFDNFDNKEE